MLWFEDAPKFVRTKLNWNVHSPKIEPAKFNFEKETIYTLWSRLLGGNPKFLLKRNAWERKSCVEKKPWIARLGYGVR